MVNGGSGQRKHSCDHVEEVPEREMGAQVGGSPWRPGGRRRGAQVNSTASVWAVSNLGFVHSGFSESGFLCDARMDMRGIYENSKIHGCRPGLGERCTMVPTSLGRRRERPTECPTLDCSPWHLL